MQPKEPNKQNEKQEPETGQSPTEFSDLWNQLAKRGYKIEEITPKHYRLTGGEHYYQLENQSRTVVCTTCPVRHGGILEAHRLTEYRLENGVLYFQDKPLNSLPLDK